MGTFHQVRDTSLEAYAAIKPHITAKARTVLNFIKGDDPFVPNHNTGATCYEVCVALDMKPQSVSARINELHTGGYLRDEGDRRKTDSGRKAIVWVAC